MAKRKNWNKIDDTYWKHTQEDLDVEVKSDGDGGWDFDIYVDGNLLPQGFFDSKENALSEAHDFMERNKENVNMDLLREDQSNFW